MAMMQLDKYARDGRTWRGLADCNYLASQTLFVAAAAHPNLYFAAVTLGHHALEMFLKTALILEGMTVFNPKEIRRLDPSIGLKPSDCVWGHELVALAEKLAERRKDFDLSAEMPVRAVILKAPVTVREGLTLYDPFFSELRYPQELKNVQGFGEEEYSVLEELACCLEPFIEIT